MAGPPFLAVNLLRGADNPGPDDAVGTARIVSKEPASMTLDTVICVLRGGGRIPR